jgi:hypothetical protein
MSVGDDGDRVTVTFQGHLAPDDGIASAQAFGDVIRAGQVDVVWDLREMSGYDSEAREAWQEAVWPNRGNIRSLTLVGARPAIRVGALMLAMFIGAPWKFTEAPPEAC